MKPTWDDLQLCHIDLHFHAGTGLPPESSIEDYVSYAEASGRRVLGITDHWGRFVRQTDRVYNHYNGLMKGFAELAADVQKSRENHPDMLILLGPEAGFGNIFDGSIHMALEIDEVNYFIGEPGMPADALDATEKFIEAMTEMASVRDKTGKPCFVAHPLRIPINTMAGKDNPTSVELRPNSAPRPLLATYDDPRAHVEELFHLDISALARASVEYDIPFEINTSCWERIQIYNAQWLMDRYLFFYRTFLDEGAKVILGSDLHNTLKSQPAGGLPAPFVPASILNVEPRQMTLLNTWID